MSKIKYPQLKNSFTSIHLDVFLVFCQLVHAVYSAVIIFSDVVILEGRPQPSAFNQNFMNAQAEHK